MGNALGFWPAAPASGFQYQAGHPWMDRWRRFPERNSQMPHDWGIAGWWSYEMSIPLKVSAP